MTIGVRDVKAEPVMELLYRFHLQRVIVRSPDTLNLRNPIKSVIKSKVEGAAKRGSAIFLRECRSEL